MPDNYILKIDKCIEEDCFRQLLLLVSDEKRQRIQKFYRSEDAQRSLLGDLLARYALFQKLGHNDFIFGLNPYGKPFLQNFPHVHFNISHSGSWVVCAIDEFPVGIDVEEIKATDFKIAERFFSPPEYRSLLEQPPGERLEYYYSIWTLKESYIKAKGKGLWIPLDSFTIDLSDSTISVSANNQAENYCFHSYKPDRNYICSICSKDHGLREPVMFSVSSFLEQLSFQYDMNRFFKLNANVKYPAD